MISTRIAQSNDIKTLVEMMDDFYAESDYTLDHQEAGQTFSALLSNPSLGCVWIVSSEGRGIGYVVMTSRFSMEYGGMIADIDDLFVKRESRRQGAGEYALNALFEHCRQQNILAVCVEVGAENEAAKSLYSKFGLAERTDNRQTLVGKLDKKLSR